MKKKEKESNKKYCINGSTELKKYWNTKYVHLICHVDVYKNAEIVAMYTDIHIQNTITNNKILYICMK